VVQKCPEPKEEVEKFISPQPSLSQLLRLLELLCLNLAFHDQPPPLRE